MEITTELVNHLAELSRLEFNEEETKNFQTEFAQTLAQMETLGKVDTSKVVLKQKSLNAETELKDDVAQKSLDRKDAILDAPETMGSSIAVPKMVD